LPEQTKWHRGAQAGSPTAKQLALDPIPITVCRVADHFTWSDMMWKGGAGDGIDVGDVQLQQMRHASI